jgi:hypothetical protein
MHHTALIIVGVETLVKGLSLSPTDTRPMLVRGEPALPYAHLRSKGCQPTYRLGFFKEGQHRLDA